jgi:hypothetical protein
MTLDDVAKWIFGHTDKISFNLMLDRSLVELDFIVDCWREHVKSLLTLLVTGCARLGALGMDIFVTGLEMQWDHWRSHQGLI